MSARPLSPTTRPQAALEGQKTAMEKVTLAAGYAKVSDEVRAADEEKATKLEGQLSAVEVALQNLSA